MGFFRRSPAPKDPEPKGLNMAAMDASPSPVHREPPLRLAEGDEVRLQVGPMGPHSESRVVVTERRQGALSDPEVVYRGHLLKRFEDTKAQLARASDAEGRAADLSAEAQLAREAAQEQYREAALALRRVADGAVR